MTIAIAASASTTTRDSTRRCCRRASPSARRERRLLLAGDVARVVLVDVELAVEARGVGVGAQEALDVGRGRAGRVELLVLERAQVAATRIFVACSISGKSRPWRIAGLAQLLPISNTSRRLYARFAATGPRARVDQSRKRESTQYASSAIPAAAPRQTPSVPRTRPDARRRRRRGRGRTCARSSAAPRRASSSASSAEQSPATGDRADRLEQRDARDLPGRGQGRRASPRARRAPRARTGAPASSPAAARRYCLRYGRPTAAGGIERPITPATAISVSTYGRALNRVPDAVP